MNENKLVSFDYRVIARRAQEEKPNYKMRRKSAPHEAMCACACFETEEWTQFVCVCVRVRVQRQFRFVVVCKIEW